MIDVESLKRDMVRETRMLEVKEQIKSKRIQEREGIGKCKSERRAAKMLWSRVTCSKREEAETLSAGTSLYGLRLCRSTLVPLLGPRTGIHRMNHKQVLCIRCLLSPLSVKGQYDLALSLEERISNCSSAGNLLPKK